MTLTEFITDARKMIVGVLIPGVAATAAQGFISGTTAASITGVLTALSAGAVYVLRNEKPYEKALRKITPETWWKPPAEPAPLVTGTLTAKGNTFGVNPSTYSLPSPSVVGEQGPELPHHPMPGPHE